MTVQNVIEKAYSTTPTASTISVWDANSNLSANNHLSSYTTTVTSASPVTLTVGSTFQQFFTGSTAQTLTMPVANTLVLGQSWYIVNNSSATLTVQSSGSNTIIAMAANTVAVVVCILTSGTTAASWYAEYEQSSLSLPLSLANGGTGQSLSSVNSAVFSTTGGGAAQLSTTLPTGLALQTPASGTLTNCTGLPVAGGGTGAASFNTNGVIISNTTSTGALAGLSLTDGQVVIGSSAGAPAAATLTAGTGVTITNGHNTITVAASGASSAWVQITRTVASSSASVVFSSLTTTYQAYAIVLSNVIPVTNAVNMVLTYNAIASNYVWACGSVAAGGGTFLTGGSTSASNIVLNNSTAGSSIANNAGNGWSGIIFLYNPDTSNAQHNTYHGTYWNGTTMVTITGSGLNTGTTAVTSVTFAMSSGNISSGVFELYGIVA